MSPPPADPTKRELLGAQLRALIDDLGPGAALPTERTLSERFGVARMTLRRALSDLAAQGLLRSAQGSGTYVLGPPLQLRLRLGSFAQELRRLDVSPATTTVECVLDLDAPAEVRSHLNLRANQHPARLIRLRLGDGHVLALERTWLPKSLAGPLLKGDTPDSLYEYFDAHGGRPDGGEESVTARMPTAREADLLGISPSSPVMQLVRQSTRAGRPIEYAESILAAHRTVVWFPLQDNSIDTAEP